MGIFDLFKGSTQQAPQQAAPPIAAYLQRTNIDLDVSAAGQANLVPLVAKYVDDFRYQKSVCFPLQLHVATDGNVHAYSNGQHIGQLPRFWNDAGLILLRRAAELGRPSVTVLAEAEWERKAGPFEVAVALGHSANVEKIQFVLASEAIAAWPI